MNLKILQLDNWMKPQNEFFSDICNKELDECFKQINPILYRPGRYVFGDLCWFELDDGRAFNYEKSQFLYDLSLLEDLKLRNCEIVLLKQLNICKLISKQQLDMLNLTYNKQDLRKIKTSGYIFRKKCMEKRKKKLMCK